MSKPKPKRKTFRKEIASINNALKELDKLSALSDSFVDGGLCNSLSRDLDNEKFKRAFLETEYFSAIHFSFSTVSAIGISLNRTKLALLAFKVHLKEREKIK